MMNVVSGGCQSSGSSGSSVDVLHRSVSRSYDDWDNTGQIVIRQPNRSAGITTSGSYIDRVSLPGISNNVTNSGLTSAQQVFYSTAADKYIYYFSVWATGNTKQFAIKIVNPNGNIEETIFSSLGAAGGTPKLTRNTLFLSNSGNFIYTMIGRALAIYDFATKTYNTHIIPTDCTLPLNGYNKIIDVISKVNVSRDDKYFFLVGYQTNKKKIYLWDLVTLEEINTTVIHSGTEAGKNWDSLVLNTYSEFERSILVKFSDNEDKVYMLLLASAMVNSHNYMCTYNYKDKTVRLDDLFVVSPTFVTHNDLTFKDNFVVASFSSSQAIIISLNRTTTNTTIVGIDINSGTEVFNFSIPVVLHTNSFVQTSLSDDSSLLLLVDSYGVTTLIDMVSKQVIQDTSVGTNILKTSSAVGGYNNKGWVDKAAVVVLPKVGKINKLKG